MAQAKMLMSHAGHATINKSVLDEIDFITNNWNGNQKNPLTGIAWSAYTDDFWQQVKRVAGTDGTVLSKNGAFVFMREQSLNIFRARISELEEQSQLGALSPAERKELIDAARVIAQANTNKEENDQKARVCLDIAYLRIAQTIKTTFVPLIEQHGVNFETLLLQLKDKTYDDYPVDVAIIADANHAEMAEIGIAKTPEEVIILATALQRQLDRQNLNLFKENPDVIRRREGLRIDAQRMLDSNAAIAAYHAANELLRAVVPVQHPPPVPDLVLTVAMTPQGYGRLANYNLLKDQLMDDSDNDFFVDVIPPSMSHQPGDLPPAPPAKCLKDDAFRPMTDREIVTILRNKIESNTNGESLMGRLRAEVVNALKENPVPTLVVVAQRLTTETATNPQSDNHIYHQILQAQAAQSSQRSRFQPRAHNAFNGSDASSATAYADTLGAFSAHAYGGDQTWSAGNGNHGGPFMSASASSANAQDGYGYQIHQMAHASAAVPSRQEINNMTDEQLGKRVREEAERAYPCFYWGTQPDGRQACGAELALGMPCNFQKFHFPEHTGPPAKTFDRRSNAPAPGMPGPYLRPPGQV